MSPKLTAEALKIHIIHMGLEVDYISVNEDYQYISARIKINNKWNNIEWRERP